MCMPTIITYPYFFAISWRYCTQYLYNSWLMLLYVVCLLCKSLKCSIIITLYLLCHILSVFTIIVYDSTECAGEFLSIFLFKNALGILAARCTSCNAWHILLCISAILPEAISDGRLNPTTDIILLLTTYRGGSHLTSDITSYYCQYKQLLL